MQIASAKCETARIALREDKTMTDNDLGNTGVSQFYPGSNASSSSPFPG